MQRDRKQRKTLRGEEEEGGASRAQYWLLQICCLVLFIFGIKCRTLFCLLMMTTYRMPYATFSLIQFRLKKQRDVQNECQCNIFSRTAHPLGGLNVLSLKCSLYFSLHYILAHRQFGAHSQLLVKAATISLVESTLELDHIINPSKRTTTIWGTPPFPHQEKTGRSVQPPRGGRSGCFPAAAVLMAVKQAAGAPECSRAKPETGASQSISVYRFPLPVGLGMKLN